MQSLANRGVNIHDGILIQKSSFGDRRPTIFVVKIFLPKDFNFAWENLNLTFDQEHQDSEIGKSAEASWRKPLPFEVQSALSALKLTDKYLTELSI